MQEERETRTTVCEDRSCRTCALWYDAKYGCEESKCLHPKYKDMKGFNHISPCSDWKKKECSNCEYAQSPYPNVRDYFCTNQEIAVWGFEYCDGWELKYVKTGLRLPAIQ